MQARWVVAGACAVMGACWALSLVLVRLGVESREGWQAVFACAALVGGGLVVAHAPLRPWREPALAGTLGTAAVIGLVSARPELMLGRAVPSWLVGAALVIGSAAMAAVGGLAVRRIAVAASSLGRILVLSTLVTYAAMGVVPRMLAGMALNVIALAVLGCVALGGFVTQAAVAWRRPFACGGGGLMLGLAIQSFRESGRVASVSGVIGGSMLILMCGAAGAALAWWLFRRGGFVTEPDAPQARTR